jgi:hypothetical protein
MAKPELEIREALATDNIEPIYKACLKLILSEEITATPSPDAAFNLHGFLVAFIEEVKSKGAKLLVRVHVLLKRTVQHLQDLMQGILTPPQARALFGFLYRLRFIAALRPQELGI